MKSIILSGAAIAAVFVTPALAQPSQEGVRAAQPVTRALVETQVRERFARVDANKDGFVTQEEAQAFRATARTQRQGLRAERRGNRGGGGREAASARLDANADGMISRAEFTQRRDGATQGERRGARAERGGRGAGGFGARAFTRLDTDGDGRISLAEATQARLRSFEQMDADRDGRITPEERRARRAARDRG